MFAYRTFSSHLRSLCAKNLNRYRRDVLAVPEQAHDVQMIVALEVEPTYRKSANTPLAQAWQVALIAELR